jgi:CBS domain containing-hemolysin-like protein
MAVYKTKGVLGTSVTSALMFPIKPLVNYGNIVLLILILGLFGISISLLVIVTKLFPIRFGFLNPNNASKY